MKQLGKTRALVAIGAIALVAAACSSGGGATTAPASQAPAESTPAESPSGSAAASPSQAGSLSAGSYKIGYSNGGGVGNGFREEQVCTAKAQWAAYGGKPDDLVVKHRNTDAAGQASDIRDLIAAGVDAIVFNPNDPEALNPALEEAKAAGSLRSDLDTQHLLITIIDLSVSWVSTREDWAGKFQWSPRDPRELDEARLAAILDVVSAVARPAAPAAVS